MISGGGDGQKSRIFYDIPRISHVLGERPTHDPNVVYAETSRSPWGSCMFLNQVPTTTGCVDRSFPDGVKRRTILWLYLENWSSDPCEDGAVILTATCRFLIVCHILILEIVTSPGYMKRIITEGVLVTVAGPGETNDSAPISRGANISSLKSRVPIGEIDQENKMRPPTD
jgi:hypothetical protein